MIYLTVSPDTPLTQGDLLDGCRILRHTGGDDVDRISPPRHRPDTGV